MRTKGFYTDMRSFDYRKEYERLLSPEIVSRLIKIHECKGRQELLVEEKGYALRDLAAATRLKEERMVQSFGVMRCGIDASCGTSTGFGHGSSSDGISVRSGMIFRLYRDMYDCSEASDLVSHDSVSHELDLACEALSEALGDKDLNPLVLISVFMLDFLCIKPFEKGNGHMSRMLMLLMLFKTGYSIGDYVSIEKVMEDTRGCRRKAFAESSVGWKEGKNDYVSFVRYILDVIAASYHEFSVRADDFVSGRVSKISRVAMLMRDSGCQVTKPEILRQLPDVSQKTCERALKVLLDGGQIIKLGGGRYTSYIWNKDCQNYFGDAGLGFGMTGGCRMSQLGSAATDGRP